MLVSQSERVKSVFLFTGCMISVYHHAFCEINQLIMTYRHTAANGAAFCCFEFHKKPIPEAKVVSYEETREDCSLPGVMYVFYSCYRFLAGCEYLKEDDHSSTLTRFFLPLQFNNKKVPSPVCRPAGGLGEAGHAE